MARLQRGFTLIELMIAMLIGVVILLGASQLFSLTARTARTVESLGERQSGALYLASTLMRDIRHADWVSVEEKGSRLRVGFDDEQRLYGLSDEGDANGRSLMILGEAQPVVSGLADEPNAFLVEPIGTRGLYQVSISLRHADSGVAETDMIRFRVMHRASAVRAMREGRSRWASISSGRQTKEAPGASQ